jgi:hypothetical protein
VWKKVGEKEEASISKVGLVTLLAIEWKEPNHDALVKNLNTFVIKGFEIYFGKKCIMYVISKYLIAYAFGVCQNGYIEDSKGQVIKTLTKELLFKHDIKPPYTNAKQWNVNKCKLPISVRFPKVIFVIYQREKVNNMSNKNALTFMKVEEGIEADWA